VYGYAFEASDPVSFDAKLFLQTGIHTFNGAPLGKFGVRMRDRES